ncbi:hypothetical protein [Nocardia sp. NPDC051832]|uniref:hypothetical protein n=1 Tax=Nocardia sp. NPDC051832 TaxID=3155673 RepID=UPI003433ECAC
MKRGIVTERHVVIYCDTCGDLFSENENEGICFASVSQAIEYLATRSAGVGWLYDGDLIRCDGCLASAYCLEHGHTFPKSWQSTETPLGTLTTRIRTCDRCGTPEREAQP